MDDRRFDALTRRLASRVDRRGAIKGLLGLSGLAALGGVARAGDVRAARRPTPTPKPVMCPGGRVVCGSGCCCPGGTTACGADCCPTGQAQCCDGACCYGTCYGEELCCPTGQRVCGGVCLPAGACCSDDECPAGWCIDFICVPYTPTTAPTQTAVPTPACQVDGDCGPVVCTADGSGTIGPVCRDGQCAEGGPIACPTGYSCLNGQCVAHTPTATPSSTPLPTPTETAVPTQTATSTPIPPQVGVAITPACFPQAIVSGFPPNFSIPEVRFLAKNASGVEFSLGTYANQFVTDNNGAVTATGTAPIVNSALEVRATASIGATVYTSGFIAKTCSITPTPSNTPAQTPAATQTGEPSATPSPTATLSPTATQTATPGVPTMSAIMLAIPDRCFVVIDLSGFPPNDRLNFSMLAKKDDLVYRFLDDQYRDDVPVDQNGNLETFVMGPVWVEPDPRDPFAEISVCPIAYSPRSDRYASADCMVLQAICNPD